MESVSLFPEYRLELCDMQCKGEEMIIQSTILLKVSVQTPNLCTCYCIKVG